MEFDDIWKNKPGTSWALLACAWAPLRSCGAHRPKGPPKSAQKRQEGRRIIVASRTIRQPGPTPRAPRSAPKVPPDRPEAPRGGAYSSQPHCTRAQTPSLGLRDLNMSVQFRVGGIDNAGQGHDKAWHWGRQEEMDQTLGREGRWMRKPSQRQWGVTTFKFTASKHDPIDSTP